MLGSHRPSLIAIDLGAESCRISRLEWQAERPRISLMHRFDNAPIADGSSLYWDLDRILCELAKGLLLGGDGLDAPIVSLGVDGWAVDYVRLNDAGVPLGPPHCYRDARTEATIAALRAHCADEELYQLIGAQPLRINTLYQLMADGAAGVPHAAPWTNLPEHVLTALGGRRVAEYTNATHTGLVDMGRHAWSEEVFRVAGLDASAAPTLVQTGTDVGVLRGLPDAPSALTNTRLIATACHDTASAVAAIPLEGDDWAYISSGTWSLVGTLLDQPLLTAEACRAGFTNQGAAGDRVCFHKNVNGMWLLKQTIEQLSPGASIVDLITAAENAPAPDGLLEVDDPDLLLPGAMASRINEQRVALGLAPIRENASELPRFASLIFHSLAERYAVTLRDAQGLTGKRFRRLAIVGGGSRNGLLNRLTARATGMEVCCGVAESSTIGNFAIQLATWEDEPNSPTRIAYWARVLTAVDAC
ncbi:MAG: Rhamnulokinase [Acidobacteriaceae bacterium]|nr:Rhamnulokinase [Acidobacteriaceae bacterium]